MPAGNESSYVAQYWPELAKITGAQVPAQQPIGFLGKPEPVREFGKRQFGPSAPKSVLADLEDRPEPAPENPMVAKPQSALEEAVATQAVPSIGARAEPPAAPDAKDEFGFWKIAEQMTEDEKKKVMKDFEDAGIDIEAKYNELAEMGEIDAGLIKKGPDGKIDRKDMGLFLMEFGLRQLSAGGPGKDFGQTLGEAALGTMEARRARHQMDMKNKESALERSYRKSKDEQERKERGLAAVEREQGRRTDIATKQAELSSREADRREMREQRAADARMRSADRAEDRKSREEIAAENREARIEEAKLRREQMETDKLAMRDKDVAEATAKHIAALDENILASVEGKRWRDMTPEEKEDYTTRYARKIRSTFGAGRDVQPGGGARPSWVRGAAGQ